MSKLGIRLSISLAWFVLLMAGLAEGAFAQQPTPVFTPGNLIVAVSGCATEGGTCTDIPYSGNASMINGPAGGYSDDQGSPWTLFQYSVNGASSATYVNSVQLPQLQFGANLPVSNDYGSLSEGTLQLSGDGRFLTMYGFGLNAATFNGNYLYYCPGNTGTLASSCVPENDNPAMAQTGSLLGQSYSGNIPVPRVAALIDPYGNVNSSTVLYNIHNQNDARSAYTANGSIIYVSGQGCKTWDPTDELCDGNSTSPYDDTMGVYLSPVGVTNDAPTPITGPDNGPTGCASLSTCDSSIDTRMVQIYNGTVYVSLDSKPGSSTGGYNRSYVGTMGAAGATSVFTCAGVGAGCPTGDGPYGPALMPGFGNTGGTGKYTINSQGSGNNSNGNSFNNTGLAINLAPQNFWFASPTVLYVADTGFPKNTSNGPDAVCTADGGKSSATVGDGGLQKWILNPTVTATVTSGSTTVSASSGAFTQGEVGLPISGTGIPAGTTIASVSGAGANATLSVKATANGTSVTVSGWSLAYTLYNGLNLVLNGDCDPNTPIGPGGDAATGLYGVTGVVNNGVATLYVTSYPNNDLINSYLYGITDTLSTMKMTSPGTAFTQLATAPSDSVFRGVSMAPSLPNGSETITSTPSGLTFTTSGTGCAAGTYIAPTTLSWTPGSSCTLSVAASQTVSGGPVNPATTTYNFVSWQDGTTNPVSDTVTAPSTTAVYNIAFQTTPTVVFPTANAITYGQTLASSTLTGGSASVGINGTNVPGTFAWANSSTVPAFGTSSQSVTFTPTDTTDYASVTGTVSVTAGQAATTINTLPTAGAITYGQALTSSVLMGGSAVVGTTSVPGSFAFTNPTTVPPTGTSSQSITFTPTNTTDYSSATGTVNVTVNQATTTINTSPTASAITYGQALSSSALTGGSAVSGATSVPGTFTFTAPTIVPPTGMSGQSITFTPTDTTDYTSATGTVNVTVNQAAAVISISNTTQTYSGSPEGVTVTTTPPGLGITASYTGINATTYGPSATAPTNPGTYSVVVTVVDPNYAGQQSGTLTINQLDPTVSLALLQGSPTSTPYGTTVYFVLSTATTPQCPTGTAQLYVDGSASGSPVTLTSPCSTPIQFQIATLTAGAHSIYVAYSGDTYFEQENTSTLSYTVTQDATTVTLAASGTSVNVDQPLTFTATVTPTSPNNAAGPTGTVTFYDGTTQIGTGSTLTATAPYTSAFTISSLAAGPHNISATFVDSDGNFGGNSSGVDVETVNLIVPTINWTPSPTTFPYGTALGSGQLNASAVDSNNNPISGTFAYNFVSGTVLPAGTVNLTASFTPSDPTTYATNSASVTITVNQATPTVSVWPTASAITYGQTLASSTLSGGTASTGGAFAFTTPSTAPATGTAAQSVTFTPTDTTDYTSVTGTVNVTVNQATTTVSAWPTASAITYGQTLASSTLSGGTASTAGTFAFSTPSTAPAVGTAAQSVTFTPADTTDYTAVIGTVNVTVNQATPTVTFPTASAITYGQTLASSTLSGGTASTAGTFAFTTPSTAPAVGTAAQSVTFTPANTTDYTAVIGTVNVTVNKATPTVTFPVASAITYGQTLASSTLSGGTASTAGTFAFTTPSTAPAVGTAAQSVTFTPANTTEYTTVIGSVNVTVNKATPTVTFTGAPATAPYESTFNVVATTNATTTASITASGACKISGATVTITTGSGTCSLTASWAADANYLAASATQSTTAELAIPTITWATPAAITYGTALSGTQLDATATYNGAKVTGTLVYAPATGTVLKAGMQTLSVTFTPSNTAEYATANASVNLTVNQATTKITWVKPAAITYGTALSATQLDATASVTGTFNYSPAAGTVLTAGTQTLSVTFTPTDATDYESSTDTVSITVNKATPTIAWLSPASISYGTALSSLQLDASASVPGAFVYSPAAGAVLAAGAQTLSTTFTPTDTTDYTTAKASVTLQVNSSNPTITWTTPAAITYGTALNGTQLDASATYNGAKVAGTFVYTPATGTVLKAGTQTLSVLFTPSNTSDYTSASASVTLTVNQATPKVTWAKPAAIISGTALSSTQLDATASVPGTFVYSPPVGTVLAVGTQTLSVAFTPTDTTDYTTQTATTTITVNK